MSAERKRTAVCAPSTDYTYDELDELRGLWLSRLMFGWMVGMPESRSFEDWLLAYESRRGAAS